MGCFVKIKEYRILINNFRNISDFGHICQLLTRDTFQNI